jgi:hypothetical protein
MRLTVACTIALCMPGNATTARTLDCVIDAACFLETGCGVLDPALTYRLTISETGAVFEGHGWTSAMGLVGRSSQGESFAEFGDEKSNFLTLLPDGRIMRTSHSRIGTRLEIAGHYGQCNEIGQ